MLAKLHVVHRAVLFAATEAAAWTLGPHATPVEQFYGFVHTGDPQGQFFMKYWDNMEMPGAPSSVDESNALLDTAVAEPVEIDLAGVVAWDE